MKTVKTISIRCETKDTMKLEDMTVLQGNLKARTDDDYAKIKKSILKYGFSFPAFIWVEKKTKQCVKYMNRLSQIKKPILSEP